MSSGSGDGRSACKLLYAQFTSLYFTCCAFGQIFCEFKFWGDLDHEMYPVMFKIVNFNYYSFLRTRAAYCNVYNLLDFTCCNTNQQK